MTNIRSIKGATAPVSPAVQQAMVNLFADMGVQPQTLLHRSNSLSSPPITRRPWQSSRRRSAVQNLSFGQLVTITGTASDVGGIVAGVEISTDGGKTWHPATGRTTGLTAGQLQDAGNTVIEARAIDDSVNLQSTPATLTLNVADSLFSASQVSCFERE